MSPGAPRGRRLRAALLASCAMAVGATHGAELDPTTALAEAGPPVEAVVYLVAPAASLRAPLDESRLRQVACRHVSHDPEAIGALVDAVRRSAPTATLRVVAPDLRAALYLVAADGTTIDVLVDADHGRMPSTGSLRQAGGGEVRARDIAAAPSLTSDLHAWVARYGGSGDGC